MIRHSGPRLAAAALALGALVPAQLDAQAVKPIPSRPVVLGSSRQPGRPGSFEISASATWLGRGRAGAADANLTANRPGGGTYTLFRVKGEYAPSPGFGAILRYNITRTFALEGGFAYSHSSIEVAVFDDRELDGGFTSPRQQLSEFFIDAALAVQVPRLAFANGRGRPFVSAGAGYLRQLHEGRTVIETGQVYHVGGGIKYMLGPRRQGFVRGYGLRTDARLYVRSGGFALADQVVLSPAVSAGLVVAF